MNELRDMKFCGRISYDFYNEPMLHSNLEEVVKKTRYFLAGSSIELYTNGTLLSLSRFKSLLHSGVSRFIVTKHEADLVHQFEKTYSKLSKDEQSKVEYRRYTDIKLTNRGGILKHLGSSGQFLLPCYIPSFVMTVTVSGNILPCFEDFNESLVMGNLADSSLFDIWNSPKYREFRLLLRQGQRHRFVPCRDCNRTQALPLTTGSASYSTIGPS